MSTETETIPTLSTVADATAKLNELAESHDWVSVFWDRGWGDSGQTAQISIIVGGNGQRPLAYLTPDVYRQLCDEWTIGENTLMTFKKRRLHDFKAPPEEERTGPSSNDVAEQVIRGIMADRPELPIRVEFYRGIARDFRGLPSVQHDIVTTPVCGAGWFVNLVPGHSDVAYCAKGAAEFFGPDIIGGGIADCLAYPRTDDGNVDLDALAGDEFRAALVAAIEAKVAVIEAEKAK